MLESTAVRALKALPFVLLLSLSATHASTASSISLLDYMSANIATPSSSIPKYNRIKQFGAWVHQDASKPCHDTREMVLERDEDESVPLKFNSGGCTIKAGLWHDPYTGTDFTSAEDLQIDHVVPLKAAYYAGAYDWPAPYRCHYANYLANHYHLASVSGHENMSKGDRGPDGYLPPDHKERCDYVSRWMKIKTIWELTTTKAELAAIRQVIDEENCAQDLLYIEKSELTAQRKAANDPIAACADFGG